MKYNINDSFLFYKKDAIINNIIIMLIILFSLISCSTLKYSNGYIIDIDKKIDFKINRYNGTEELYTVYCNKEIAYILLYNPDGSPYIRQVVYNKYGKIFGLKYPTEQPSTPIEVVYIKDLDGVLPESIARKKFNEIRRKIALDNGFNTWEEYRTDIDTKNWLESEQRKQREREENEIKMLQRQQRIQEEKELFFEIDKRYGVVSVAKMVDAKNNMLVVGNIYRLSDIFIFSNNYNNRTYRNFRRDGTTLYFGEFEEYAISGIDVFYPDELLTIVESYGGIVKYNGENYRLNGHTGFIVRYLGTREVLTVASLVKIIYVFEYIGANKYVQFE